MSLLRKASWSPYLAGALVGILAVLSVVVTTVVLDKGKYLGASTTFVRASGLIEQAVAPQHVADNAYFQSKKVKVDWQMLFVLGIFAGAFISSRLGGSAKSESVPPIWRERFGNSALKRGVGAFIGGAILLFGARMAGGCPSGHGLSGNMQLSVSSLLALVFFMVGGIITARLLYGKGGQ
ncbi:YeeE/YedE thiosulfate transporter family protein [uncultured Desulfuromonas sp.]|uniref:YeeE/YedE thiosulfate transporter family protein n=1 Tax=uncultured Desulfuromonas sp. TaxID=181013 RepID=UPI002AAA87E1|nr:YeeE/YedE thiosulfate transporter family protein [uncultured Desulfuromonas sp.]